MNGNNSVRCEGLGHLGARRRLLWAASSATCAVDSTLTAAAIEAETEATRAAQQQAMDDANATIDAQRETAMSEIDARVSTDQAAVDATFRDAQQKADAEVAAGEAKADQAKKPAESQSFWDQAIDAWQSVVQAIADATATRAIPGVPTLIIVGVLSRRGR